MFFENISKAEEDVQRKEIQLEEEDTVETRMQWSQVKTSLLKCLADKTVFGKQKARVKWFKDGDSNTQFFHSMLLDKRARRYSLDKKFVGLLY